MEIEFKNGKWQFDKALEQMDWDMEAFEKMIGRFAKRQSAPIRNEFWKQYNEWVRLCGG